MSNLRFCTIIVVTHNREDQIRATLENLKVETIGSDIEIIIIDNGSSDKTKLIIEDVLVGWREAKVIHKEINVGISEGRNTGWRAARRDYILSLDDDILISRSMLEKLLGFAISVPGFGVLSPTIIDAKANIALNGYADNGKEAKTFYEACFLIHKSLLMRIGYMDEILTTAAEGLDFSIRLRRDNFKIFRLFDVLVYHFDRARALADIRPRRLAWMWSFSRVYWKNYSVPVACFQTARTLSAHFRSGYRLFGLGYWFVLCREAVLGAKSGWLSR